MEDSAPPEILTAEQVLAIDFHPTHNIIACGQIHGVVELYRYSPSGNAKALKLDTHAGSVRSVCFSQDGLGMDISVCSIMKLYLRK